MNRLCPRTKRSKLGPTRYQPRCNVRRGKQPCNNPLPKGQHVGVCDRCFDEFALLTKRAEA
jgi:hypothetical protein